ncbi:MAG: hypothetical protein R3272_13310 [Candidatus Promineifilaceae bacterium]|nr:hypothetical protein [Candidatus Promineifilaceae bacterium]
MHDERHKMELAKVHPDGAQEWYCPLCGRRLLLQWPPDYRRIVLYAGDEAAIHDGDRLQADPPAGSAHPSGLDPLWRELLATLDLSVLPPERDRDRQPAEGADLAEPWLSALDDALDEEEPDDGGGAGGGRDGDSRDGGDDPLPF